MNDNYTIVESRILNLCELRRLVVQYFVSITNSKEEIDTFNNIPIVYQSTLSSGKEKALNVISKERKIISARFFRDASESNLINLERALLSTVVTNLYIHPGTFVYINQHVYKNSENLLMKYVSSNTLKQFGIYLVNKVTGFFNNNQSGYTIADLFPDSDLSGSPYEAEGPHVNYVNDLIINDSRIKEHINDAINSTNLFLDPKFKEYIPMVQPYIHTAIAQLFLYPETFQYFLMKYGDKNVIQYNPMLVAKSRTPWVLISIIILLMCAIFALVFRLQTRKKTKLKSKSRPKSKSKFGNSRRKRRRSKYKPLG